MNTQLKRSNAKLLRYYVARELNKSFTFMKDVDRKKRSLNAEDLNKFIQIVTVDAKEHAQKQRLEIMYAKQWYAENDTETLNNLLTEFKITKTILASDLGVAYSTVTQLFTKTYQTDEFILMLYDYFKNTQNRRYVLPETNRPTRYKVHKENCNKYDFLKMMADLKITSGTEFERQLCISTGNVSHWLKGRIVSAPMIIRINRILSKINKTIDDYVCGDYDVKKLDTYYTQDTNDYDEEKETIVEDIAGECIETTVPHEIDKVSTVTLNNGETAKTRVFSGEIQGVSFNVDNEQVTIPSTKEDEVCISRSDYEQLKYSLEKLKEEVNFLKDTINTINRLGK